MSRLVSIISLGCLAAIGITVYVLLPSPQDTDIAIPERSANRESEDEQPWAEAIEEARRRCSHEVFDEVIGRLREHVANLPTDHKAWRALAESMLHRAAQRAHLLGMTVGHPVYTELPPEVLTDLDAAQQALDQARTLGDDSGTIHRIAAEVMSQRITGLRTAWKWNSQIETAIAKASERGADDPRLHLVLGLRKLMAPKFLGHDPDKALEHFTYVAAELPEDARPALFAAMASHLKRKRDDTLAWLEKAVTRNPHNVFARVVLERVRRDEDDPFGRDITAAEAGSAK